MNIRYWAAFRPSLSNEEHRPVTQPPFPWWAGFFGHAYVTCFALISVEHPIPPHNERLLGDLLRNFWPALSIGPVLRVHELWEPNEAEFPPWPPDYAARFNHHVLTPNEVACFAIKSLPAMQKSDAPEATQAEPEPSLNVCHYCSLLLLRPAGWTRITVETLEGPDAPTAIFVCPNCTVLHL